MGLDLKITKNGIELDTYDIIDFGKFRKASDKCRYNQGHGDGIEDDFGFCTRKGTDYTKKCECKPENCTPQIVTKAARTDKQIYAHLIRQQKNMLEAYNNEIKVKEKELLSSLNEKEKIENNITEIPTMELNFKSPGILTLLQMIDVD